jgi:large subunit ribosomal protein L25
MVKALDLRPLVYTAETHIINLVLDNGTNEKCVLREVQFDPVTDNIVHIDLMGLRMDQKMRFEVPVVLEGTAAGAKLGGIVQHHKHKLEVECLPKDLPQHIAVEIGELNIGESITVGALSLPAGVALIDNPDDTVVAISHAREEVAAAPAEGEEAAEPEVITRGKAEEE